MLDIGTANGFFAFELERRGAKEVVAVDSHPPETFNFSRKVLGSDARYIQNNIYDLDPRKLGTFDLVFCGDLLLHLDDIVGAVRKIRVLTKEIAIITSAFVDQIDETVPLVVAPMKELKEVGLKGPGLGFECACPIIWVGNLTFYRRLLEYAGFSRAEIVSTHVMKPNEDRDTSAGDRVSHVVIRGEI